MSQDIREIDERGKVVSTRRVPFLKKLGYDPIVSIDEGIKRLNAYEVSVEGIRSRLRFKYQKLRAPEIRAESDELKSLRGRNRILVESKDMDKREKFLEGRVGRYIDMVRLCNERRILKSNDTLTDISYAIENVRDSNELRVVEAVLDELLDAARVKR